MAFPLQSPKNSLWHQGCETQSTSLGIMWNDGAKKLLSGGCLNGGIFSAFPFTKMQSLHPEPLRWDGITISLANRVCRKWCWDNSGPTFILPYWKMTLCNKEDHVVLLKRLLGDVLKGRLSEMGCGGGSKPLGFWGVLLGLSNHLWETWASSDQNLMASSQPIHLRNDKWLLS